MHHTYSESEQQWNNKIKSLIEPKQLNINFRSVSGIVDLASAIIPLIQHNQHLASELIIQNSIIQSEDKPLIINQSPLDYFKNKDFFGSRNAIIVTTNKDKENLAKYFKNDSQRILTIQEAKGLEFDEVLIWNFFSNFESWQNGNNAEIKEVKRYKYNCLYVSITRARNRLYFYDENVTKFWNSANIKNLVDDGNTYDLETLLKSDESIEDIKESAHEYLNKGTIQGYKIAIELFTRAKDNDNLNKAKALLAEEEGDYNSAGDIWLKINCEEKAASCYQKAVNGKKRKFVVKYVKTGIMSLYVAKNSINGENQRKFGKIYNNGNQQLKHG